MIRDVRTIHRDKPFGHALHLMYEGGFRHIPVVDDTGHPVGLLAAHDALDLDGFRWSRSWFVARKSQSSFSYETGER